MFPTTTVLNAVSAFLALCALVSSLHLHATYGLTNARLRSWPLDGMARGELLGEVAGMPVTCLVCMVDPGSGDTYVTALRMAALARSMSLPCVFVSKSSNTASAGTFAAATPEAVWMNSPALITRAKPRSLPTAVYVDHGHIVEAGPAGGNLDDIVKTFSLYMTPRWGDTRDAKG